MKRLLIAFLLVFLSVVPVPINHASAARTAAPAGATAAPSSPQRRHRSSRSYRGPVRAASARGLTRRKASNLAGSVRVDLRGKAILGTQSMREGA